MVENLTLLNFRNFASLKASFGPGVTVFYGRNAQGKTNLLEALNVVSTLRSYRNVPDKDLLMQGEAEGFVEVSSGSTTLKIVLKEGLKEVFVNNISKKVWASVGVFRTVIFSPEDISLVTSTPALRRRFLDLLIAKADPKYVWEMLRLKEVLKNRNRVLFNLKNGQSDDLSIWDSQLIKLARTIWAKRLAAASALNTFLGTISPSTQFPNPLTINFTTPDSAHLLTEEQLGLFLEKMRGQEVARTASLVGPHRDDLEFIETKKGRPLALAHFGSRGEQRSFMLALKLGEVDHIDKATGERPTLLLDDVLSEFDQEHREIIFEFATKQQTFLTTAELTLIPEKLKAAATVYQVEEANLLSPVGGKAL